MAALTGAIGIIIGSSLSQILSQSSSLSIAFIHVILPDALFSLVLVPILLVIYNVISGGLTRT